MKKRNVGIAGSIFSLLLVSGIVYWSGSKIKAENIDANESEQVSKTTTLRSTTRDHQSEEFLANPEQEGWERIQIIEHASIPLDGGKTFNFGIGGYDPNSVVANIPSQAVVGKDVNLRGDKVFPVTPNIYLKTGSTYVPAIANSDSYPRSRLLNWSYDTGNGKQTLTTAGMYVDEITTSWNSPPVGVDGRYYKKIMKNGMPAYMYRYYTITKNVPKSNGSSTNNPNPYDVENDIQLATTMIMTGQRNGSVKVDYFIQNLPYLRTQNPNYDRKLETAPNRIDGFLPSDTPNTKVLNDFTLNGQFLPAIGTKNNAPLRLIGDQIGSYTEWPTLAMGTTRINYYLGLPNGPDNWTGGNTTTFYGATKVNPYAFSDRYGTGFEAIPGGEGEAGGPGAYLYRQTTANSISIYPAVFFKNQPKTFKPGDIEGYSFQYGMSIVSEAPTLYLDEDEYNITDQKPTAKVSGVWYDGSNLNTTLYYSVDGGPEQIYEPAGYTSSAQLGNEMPFELEIPNLSKEEHTITMYAQNSEESPKKSTTQTAKIVYVAGEPKLTLDKKNGGVGQDFTVSGSVINKIAAEPDRELHYNPTDIYIKKTDAPDSSYKLATTIDANSADSRFSYTIPASEIPLVANADYRFSIRAINKYDMISNVEDIRLAVNHAKPTFELASDIIQILDNTKPSYTLELAKLKHTGDSYPLFIQYKVDGEANWTKLDKVIGATDPSKPMIETANATFEIPAEKLPFETAHTLTVTIVDNFGVEADVQNVEFIKPGKPALVLDNKNGPSLGETQTVKGTITTEYFPAKLQYKIVKNGEAGAVYKELSENDVVIDQTSGKFSFTLDKGLFPVGASYEIFVKGMDKYNQETEEVSYRLTEVVHFKVKFVNAVGATIHPDITIDRELNDKIDLSLEQAVQDTLMKLKEEYTFDESSLPKGEVAVDSSTASWEYKFTGRLVYLSSPTAFDFGLEFASIKKMRVEEPTVIGLPLVVSDTRESKPGWSLNLKLTKELLNEDGKTILKNAVRYKNDETETILSSDAVPVVQKPTSGKYDISKDWASSQDGLKLEVPAGSITALGKYKGEILFELGETP
ncbi:hypothetical protein IGJ55_000301 [Enterococcus sp. AZ170]|uniref:hypothetical protein n=1 Tax=Enterococcus sp. AZ170 TaxID=2774747 RepID=UPI003D2FED37